METNTLGSLFLLAATATVACAQPADESAQPQATSPVGSGAMTETGGESSTGDDTDTPSDSGSTGDSTSAGSTGLPGAGDATTGGGDADTGGGGEAETGDISTGGAEPPASPEFSECPALDMVMCVGATQCLWEGLDDEGPGQGDCVADPAYCEILDQPQCGVAVGCGWGRFPGKDKGVESGCSAACNGVDQAACETWSDCVWSPPGERGVGSCG